MHGTASLAPTTPADTHAGARGVAFDGLMALLSAWLVAGIVLDNWAHHHQAVVGKLETFFTPWHAVLYSGSLAVATPLVAALLRNGRRSQPWTRALPAGYGLSLLGVLVFAVGGLADMVWHTLWGIEVGLDAAYSPPHLILGAGWILIVSGPLRAAWAREPGGRWLSQLPMVISLTFTLSIVSFYIGFSQPLMSPWASARLRLDPAEVGYTIGIESVFLYSGVLMGLLLLTVLRQPLPLGGFTIVFTLAGILMAMGTWPEESKLIPCASAALTGFAVDLLQKWLRPSAARPGELRLFAFAVPTVVYIVHFVTLKVTDGIWWSAHLQGGAIVIAGMVGWLLSYAFVPPPRHEP